MTKSHRAAIYKLFHEKANIEFMDTQTRGSPVIDTFRYRKIDEIVDVHIHTRPCCVSST